MAWTSLALAAAVLTAAPEGEQRSPTVSAQARRYQAVRAVDPITVDGRADEQTWQIAPADRRFRERQPNLGHPPPVETTLQVAYDDRALYIFVDMEAKPGDVVVRTLRRDSDAVFDDDAITIQIDASHDQRNGYGFSVNADGTQVDFLALDDGRLYLAEWDAVWSAETDRREDGWSAEFRIPFSILGIKRAQERTLGLNVSRDHSSRNAIYDWRLFVPPRSEIAASQYGSLTGVRDVEAGRALDYTPFVVGRTSFVPGFTVDPRRRPNLVIGADARIQIGAASFVEASYLTDFAQVEVDEVQVVRDRFPLFFPERRAFFINGLDVFQFGRPGVAQLLFSRRIGLVDGAPVPILGGIKVYGRSGRTSYGVLQVQTLGTRSDPSRGLVESAPASFTAARVRVRAGRRVSLGMLALGHHEFRVDPEDSAATGLDAQVLALDGRLNYYGFVAGTYAARPQIARGRDLGTSAYSGLEYHGLYVRPAVSWLWSDARFDPRLGFYRRTSASQQDARLDLAPRPRVLGLREARFGVSYRHETSADYRVPLGSQAASRTRLSWDNGAELEYELAFAVDHVQQNFELYGYTVEADRYRGFRHQAQARSSSTRAVQVQAAYEHAQVFGGVTHQPSSGVLARLGKHFAFEGRYTHVVGHLGRAHDRFNFGIANASVELALTRALTLDNVLRLDLSPGAERIGVQSRFRWRLRPGSDLFLVYRNDLPLGAASSDPSRSAFHELTLKLSIYLRAQIAR